MAERLQKVLSQWGVASRRQAEKLIQEGRVLLNGKVAVLGQKANPAIDAIQIDGVDLAPQRRPTAVYLLLNKPRQVISTCDDSQGRTSVIDLLPTHLQHGQGIHPVGRLDAASTGALILTNDGELTYQLTHPRHEIAKVYRVTLDTCPDEAVLQQWRQGIVLDSRPTLPADVRILQRRSNGETVLEIVLWEGRNRQIRRTAEHFGFLVKALHRVAIGSILLGDLPTGHIRSLTSQEVMWLRRQTQSTFSVVSVR